jgi:hypothetical protein
MQLKTEVGGVGKGDTSGLPHPHLQQASVRKFKDDVNGFSSTWDIHFLLLGWGGDGIEDIASEKEYTPFLD